MLNNAADGRILGYRLPDQAPTLLEISVWKPVAKHRIPVARVTAWLEANARTPKEQANKQRLREMLENGRRRGARGPTLCNNPAVWEQQPPQHRLGPSRTTRRP